MPHYVFDARTAIPHFPGIGRYARNLAQAMARMLQDDEQLTVLCAPDAPLDLGPAETVKQVTVPVSAFTIAQQWQIPRLLRRHHAHLYHSPYYLMPYHPGVPTVLTVYDMIPLLLPAQSSRRARIFFRAATVLALAAARHVIAISEATRRDLNHHFRHRRPVTVIPIAADPAFTPQSPGRVQALRAHYELPRSFILYLGSNKPHKNLVRLIEAYHRLPATAPLLVIAGAWIAAYPEARERAAALGLDDSRVRWLGPIAELDLPALYSAATAFVFPSLYEGFGLPPLEAMACGTPVACAHTSSLPEVVGDAALLFDPRDVEEIAATLQRLLGSPQLRHELRARGMQHARQFSWRATAAATLRVYRQVLKRKIKREVPSVEENWRFA